MTVSLVPQPTTLEFVRGDGVTVEGTLANPDGSAFDFTGYTAAAQVRRRSSDAAIAFEFDVALGGDDGTLTLSMTPEASAEVAAGTYVWDLQITSAEDVPLTIARGSLRVIADVTR